MRKSNQKKRVGLSLLGILCLIFAFSLPLSAGIQENSGEYEVYPTPQSLVYGDGTIALTNQVNVTLGKDIDTYTENRVEVTLDVLDLEAATTPASQNTDLIIGVYGSGDAADTYGESHNVDASIYQKFDAYTLWIADGDIVILGKNTDAAYYGVTTLKRIFEQLSDKSVKELTLKDYADVEFRGFIEGYYGNPWSHEDRMDLMKFGSEIKMNQYVFAPKDDPYHNARWRELYPEEDLEKISALAQAGNESKCFYVYALHPFMNRPVNLSDSTYDAEVAVVKAKLAQVIEAGVRQIAILEDDSYGESAERMVRFLNDMNEWLHEMKETYPDLKTDLLYCPTCYMATTDAKMTAISNGVSDEVHIVVTGGKIWGEVSDKFATDFHNGCGRYPYMWVNWPCNDNTKNSQIMGGHNYILHTGVDGSKYEGIILNPIQESEPSKVGIFTAADFCWQTWDDPAEGDQAWEDAFKYIDHMTPIESKESRALKEIAKHMIAQSPDQTVPGKQVAFEESVELKPMLEDFEAKLEAGTLEESDLETLEAEFQKIYDAAELYLEQGTNRRMASQMTPFLSCLRDMVQADMHFMNAIKAILTDNQDMIWTYYSQGQVSYEQSKTYGFDYYNAGTLYAKAGRKYIEPFTDRVFEYIAEEVLQLVNPEYVEVGRYKTSYSIPSSWTTWNSSMDSMFDGDDSTFVWINPGNGDSSIAGDFIQLDLKKVKPIGRVRALVGYDTADKWTQYHLEYSQDGQNWERLDSYTGAGTGTDTYEVNLNGVLARYIKLVNDVTVSKWVKFREFSVFSPDVQSLYTNLTDSGLEATFEEDTFSLSSKKGMILQPGEYIGLMLDRIRAVTDITVTGAGTDSLVLEKAMNELEWQDAKVGGGARFIRLMNKGAEAVEFDLDSFVAKSDEINPMDFLETTLDNLYATEDARTTNTTRNWMDGNLSTKAKYCATPAKDGYVTYDLGQEVTLRSLRVYVLDTAIDYPRDAMIQASLDNQNWTDILEIGDGVENPASDANVKPVESDGGWIHDTVDVAYAYVENANIDNVKARYIRLFFTAPYRSRWVELNEILINGGEFLPTVNDPTFETDAKLQRGHELICLNDGDLTTAFQPDGTKDGYVIYNLSNPQEINRINILQSGNMISNATVFARTDTDKWVKLGKMDDSVSAFYAGHLDKVYAIKVEWQDVVPTIYEIITLKNDADMLNVDLQKAQEKLNETQPQIEEARATLSDRQEEVRAALQKLDEAANEIEAFVVNIDLQKAYAACAQAEAVLAEKQALYVSSEANLARAEAAILWVNAETAETEDEKNRLRQEAEQKENLVPTKRTESNEYQKTAAEKKKEQNNYQVEAKYNEETMKPWRDAQKELETLRERVQDSQDALNLKRQELNAEIENMNRAETIADKLSADLERQKAYAQHSDAEAAVAEKEALQADQEAKIAKIEQELLLTWAKTAETEDEKDNFLAEASNKANIVQVKKTIVETKTKLAEQKENEAGSYRQKAEDRKDIKDKMVELLDEKDQATQQVQAAQTAFDDAQNKVDIAIANKNQAETLMDKLSADIVCQEAYAQRASAEVELAEKNAQKAICEANIAKVEKDLLLAWSQEAETETEKIAFQTEAAKKSAEISEKQGIATDQTAIANQKKQEVEDYNQKGTETQTELQNLQTLLDKQNQAATEVQTAEQNLNNIQLQVDAALAKVNQAATEADKLSAEVSLNKLYAARAAAEAVVAEKKAVLALKEVDLAKAEEKVLLDWAESAETEEEKEALKEQADQKGSSAETKQNEAGQHQQDAVQKKNEETAFTTEAANKQQALDSLVQGGGDKQDPNDQNNQNNQNDQNNQPKPAIKEFKYKNVKYKVLSASAKTVTAVGPTKKNVKKLTIYATVTYGGVTWKVVEIKANAFKGCKKLESVTIGSNVKKIGKQAFANCSKLKSINMKKATKITSIGTKAFSKIKSGAKFTVPAKKISKYSRMLKKAGIPKNAKIKK